jgi:hypothetical protein
MGLFPACLLLALGAGPDPDGLAGLGRPRPGGDLGAEDARYLDWLVEEFMFDPRGAVRVRIIPPPGPAGTPDPDFGWLILGTRGRTDRVYSADGTLLAVPAKRLREIDFEAHCDHEYHSKPPDLEVATDESGNAALPTHMHPLPGRAGPALADAAWLHRLGYDRLAARALAAARSAGRDPYQELRGQLANWAGMAVCDAFARRADAEAASIGEHLHRLYPDLVPSETTAVLADLDRRRRTGTFNKPPPGWPGGFAGWDDRRKTAYLIETLDEIGSGSTFESDVTDHPRFLALIELGDTAVPGLLDAMEQDSRLTRHFPAVRHVPAVPPDDLGPVRNVAEVAVRQIVRVSNLEPLRPEEAEQQSGPGYLARVRRYWSAYGHLSFVERMRAVLTNPAARPEARAEAAMNLATRVPGGPVSWHRREFVKELTPAWARPRVADAILAALDAERERAGRRRRPTYVERVYLRALAQLGDSRAGPELVRRAQDETGLRSRTAYALAAHRLGSSGPLIALARELATGTLPLGPRRGNPRSDQLLPITVAELIEGLESSELTEAGAVLAELTDPAHPIFPLLLHDLLATDKPGDVPWARQPFCLGVLRGALTDRRPTGTQFFLRGDEVEAITRTKVSRHPVPAGAVGWRENTEEWVADRAADRLARLAVGLPEPNPLRPDADSVLAEVRSTLLRYEFRPLTDEERGRLGVVQSEWTFGPVISSPNRPATAADVRAGRAVFDFNGRGRVPAGTRPGWILLKGAGNDDSRWGRVVQAEAGPDGKVVYGAVFRHAIRAVRADDVERVDSDEK